MMPTPSFIFVKMGWKPLPKSMKTPCWSLLWSLLTTICSVMNIGALSRIWHLPARQTLPRSGSGGFSKLHYSGWVALQQLWPQPNGLQEWAVLEGMICKKRLPNIEILKRSQVKAVVDLSKETLHNSPDGWPQRHRDYVKAKGSHFDKWLLLFVCYTCR